MMPNTRNESASITSALDWIAVDWGTTHLRAWAVSNTHTVFGSASSDAGMGSLRPDAFESALLALISDWIGDRAHILVLACGMVGARQGWVEAPYQDVPTRPLVPDRFQSVKSKDPRLQVHIVPGLMQLDPPDVMRGEETQIAGFMAQRPGFQGVICLPGTHTKWVHVANGQVLRFHSYMTGEVFSLLKHNSVLRHSLDADGLDQSVFRSALKDVLEEPALAVSGLFGLRAEDLLTETSADQLSAKLSAYLIGSEVHAATSRLTQDEVVLIGAPELSDLYKEALVLRGFSPEHVSAEELTLKGLYAARDLLKGRLD